ncbi:MAG: 16S rRNA (cytosine(967)-C(5))-methyltransferase RsmB [Clostridiales bacterium]|nr:16S rRNA (cytosine(967)-C(5))-methyltransferase RsmB [Clostridiales bacterium]
MIDNARLLAFRALDDVLRQGAYSNLAIKKAQKTLEARDKAFCVALFYGTLEKIITLDYILSKYLKKGTKAVIRNILRFGTYQIHFMNSVPDHAACTTSADIAKKLGKNGAVGLINGVLRNVARDKESFRIPESLEPIKHLSIQHSFPEWLIKKWVGELGEIETIKLISYTHDNQSVIHANSLKDMDNAKLETALDENNIEYIKSSFTNDVYKIKGDIIGTSMFVDGKIAIQGEASYLAAKVAIENSPTSVLDLCAAPGGKMAAMAHVHHDAEYTACDIRPNRVDIMQKQFERLGVKAKTITMDATETNPDLGNFDAVLCDVPCSVLGTVFDHPEVRYSKSQAQIDAIYDIQSKILVNAAKYVNSEGLLVYSTCTISKSENYDIVQNFLKTNDEFKAIFPKAFHGIINDKRFDGCGVQLLPHLDDTAGFYIACLKRIK